MKKPVLKTVLAVLTALACVAAPFLAIFLTGVCLPPQFSQTWYGAFPAMYDKLASAEGKRLIVAGNSNVAFGVDSALAEQLLAECGLDYTVCNFGLYGSLGTKMMLDIAVEEAREGDIVVLVPELAAQALSTYFSADEAWYAIDGDMSIFFAFNGEGKGALAGAYASYTARKLEYFAGGEPASPSGIYASSSFDENGDLKNYPRQYNAMSGGFDKNNPLALDISLYAPDFVAYVNGCAAELERRGAKLMYSFPPMNASAFSGERDERSFQTAVTDLFDCPVISDVADYIMEEGWFYDSNFHLNSAGMTVRTVQLVNDIKNELGNTSKTEIDLPNMPVAPDEDVDGEGDNSCKDCFTYELVDGYYTVTGLTEEGAGRSELVLPYQVNGIYINNFTAEVFAGNTAVQSIYIQGNISVLPDGAFSGCSSLSAVYLAHGDPADISVGYSLFEGAPRMRVYVPEEALGAFTDNYFCGRSADRPGAY